MIQINKTIWSEMDCYWKKWFVNDGLVVELQVKDREPKTIQTHIHRFNGPKLESRVIGKVRNV